MAPRERRGEIPFREQGLGASFVLVEGWVFLGFSSLGRRSRQFIRRSSPVLDSIGAIGRSDHGGSLALFYFSDLGIRKDKGHP